MTRYRHICITPILAAPGADKVIPLPPQFVEPQGASGKQDCELGAAKRWLAQWGSHYAPWRVTVMGDDLYCHQPLCQQVLAQGFEFIFTCKPDSHVELYDWLADLERCAQVRTVTRMSRSGKYGRQRASETYRYARHLPLRNSDDALMVNWCELTITEPSGKVLYRNSWATSHPIDDSNVEALACAGRTRWKIENENNNVLKTRGYHFEHNYGHGKKHLANLLTTMILLAFLMHTILDWVDEAYQTVRKLLPSRRTFFEHLRALLQYLPFDNWAQLTSFMLARLTDIEPETQ